MADPEKIGKYSIIQRIGRGGMGYVYRAHDPLLKRDVAIKTMLKDVSDDPELRNRFQREAQSAGGLRHPNIVTIYDLGEDESGCPFIAMEFLTGTDMEHIIKNKIELPLLKKLDVIIQTCQGLGYAHANGIVHRDIKTANIRLLDNGEAKIMDFGIAKMTSSHFTRTGMIMGTPHYMAPEQIRGEKVDGRADIFSLGVVLYELLVYRKPFSGDNPTTVLFKIIHEPPEPLVDETFVPPDGIEDIVSRAIAKKPEERYQTCEEMAEDLRYVYSSVQQQQYDDSVASGAVIPTQTSGSRTGTPLPTMRRGPGTGSFGTSPAPGTPFPSKTNFTLPSHERAAQLEGVPANATEIQNPTQATVAQSLPVDGAIAPQRADLPPISPTPIPSPTRLWWIAGSTGVLGVGLLVAVLLGIFGGKQNVNPTKPPIDKNLPPATSVTQSKGWITLNIQPWAEISSIKDAKGNAIVPPFSMTPCKLQLPAGKYSITLSNPQFETKVVEVEVRGNENILIQEKLKGFDNAKAVDSLDL